jgi:Glycosyl transferases group 1
LKLALGPFTTLSGYVSREIWCTFEGLRAHGWHLRESSRFDAAQPGELPSYFKARLGAVPEVVLIWESYAGAVRHMRSLRDAGARVYVMTDDLHWTERDGMREALQLADGILTPYAPVFGDFFPEVDAAKVTWVPHAAGPDFLLPVNDAPAPVVFVSGAINDHYPLRMAMRDLARRRPELARLHEHPGYYINYNHESDGRVGRGYAEKIASCLAAFTDGLKHRYIVAKHFEIPAAGALLIADRACAPQLAMLGFIDGEHYLSASADDLEEVVEHALRNREEIDAIRRRGHALVHARHTTACRAREIDAQLLSARTRGGEGLE